MAKVDVNGTSFEFIESGSGDPVVFVHGSLSDYRTWHAQQDEFSKKYRTLAYSRRYHWPNQEIAEDVDYSMAEHVEDLEKVILSFDSSPVHLIGHSYGAFLSLLLAIRKPELVRSLVLAEPPAVTLLVSLPPKPQEILKLLLTRPRTGAALIKFVATGLAPATSAFEKNNMDEGVRLFGNAVLGRKAYDQLTPEQMQQVQANLIKAEFLGSGFLPLDSVDVKRVQAPTLLINGEHSPALFKRLIIYLDELLPHSEHVVIPDASHNTQENNPKAYNSAVLSFLEDH